jgi:hypothetical protein
MNIHLANYNNKNSGYKLYPLRLMTNPPVLIGRGLLFIDQTMAKSVLQK